MDEVLAFLSTAGILAVPLIGLVLLASRVRRRGLTGGYSLMGPFDELWHPAAVAPRIEVQVQYEAPAPAPLPGDRPAISDVPSRGTPSAQ